MTTTERPSETGPTAAPNQDAKGETPSETPTAPPVSERDAPRVSEREARQVAEAAREAEWRKPSFGKELFLGRFRLDLIYPYPAVPDSADADDFLAKLEAYARSEIDGARIEREARIPDEVFQGLA